MKIFTVIVAYHPHHDQLSNLCRTIVDCGSRVVVVDNTEASTMSEGLADDACTVVRLGRNSGIAHAQNLGIDVALGQGADVIAFFDQDSKPDSAFLAALTRGLEPGRPAVVAPVCVDAASGEEVPSFRLGKLGWARNVLAGGRMEPYPVDLVISSGSAATAVTFSVAGKMDEDFFIDYVDFEWCLRCRSKNVPISVVPRAVMKHSIGDKVIGVWPLRGVMHSAVRSYYKVRNGFLLFRKQSVPLLFALRETISALIRHVALLPFVTKKRDYVAVLFSGVWHGLTDVRGAKPVARSPVQESGIL